jgi:hypothetical protein
MVADDDRLARWARTTMLARGDAIWNLADFLAKIYRGEIPHPPFPSRKTVTKIGRYRLPKWALYEYRRIRNKKMRQNQPLTILRVHEKDHISHSEIERRTNRWKRVLASYDNRKKSCEA